MDDFSDDGLDELNANALDELENNAIQFTQARRFEPSQTPLEYDFDDDDFDDAVVTDELRGKPVVLPDRGGVNADDASPTLGPGPQQTHHQQAWPGPVTVATSHIRPAPAGSSNRSPAQAQYAPRPSQGAPYSQMRPPPLPRPTPTMPTRYLASQVPQHAAATGNAEQVAMQARIRELEAKLQAKDGEVHIVRSRLEKYRQDHDRELQAFKKQTAEQLAKQERALEAARVAERTAASELETATTELEFTRRDLKEEVDRAKRKERDGGGVGTPRKPAAAKTWGVSDGFEDVEMAASPSKGNRSKNPGAVASIVQEPIPSRLTRTPTKAKRKRPAAVDSPVMALETTEDVVMHDDDDGSRTASVDTRTAPATSDLPRKGMPFDFIKVILNHSSGLERPLSFDFLAGFSLPSKPSESIASILLQKLAITGDPDDPMRLPIEFCELVIDIWFQCRQEGCLAPIAELVSLVSFTLQLNTIAIAPYITETLVSAAMDSCGDIGISRVHRQNTTGDPTDEAFKNLKDNIPTANILSLLYLTALGCATSAPIRGTLSNPIVDFWNCVHPDFVLMMIRSHNQPVDDFVTTLKLLCTSSFPESIGPISSAPNRTVDLVAPAMIERLTYHLVETHQWGVGRQQRWSISSALLRTLAAFARSPFGMQQLAVHDYAIPRLVMFLSFLIEELYDGNTNSRPYRLPPVDSTSQDERDGGGDVTQWRQRPDELQTLIAYTMLLLHTIVRDTANKDRINIASKLAKFTGCSQKYLLSLARLNFAEDGVSEETAELAHELLELAVTEEEGAELGEFFGG
ncbi:hypothetical protein BX600DRAFT_429615 [Xylariales sp. PMI_506]|nr:hypothetical protein BX600DRAFT_429615 [Xylariales sp. PMI_506]